MGKNTSQKVSMYLKSLKDYYYALPGFLPIVRAPFLYDRNADYTLTLRPEGLTRPWWKVYRNTLPPATVSRDWQISFKKGKNNEKSQNCPHFFTSLFSYDPRRICGL